MSDAQMEVLRLNQQVSQFSSQAAAEITDLFSGGGYRIPGGIIRRIRSQANENKNSKAENQDAGYLTFPFLAVQSKSFQHGRYFYDKKG